MNCYLQSCIGEAPVSETLFRRLLSQAGDNYRRTVPEEAIPLLARVRLDKQLLVDEGNREIVALTMANNLILQYQNESEWFDLHPALREWAPILAAIEYAGLTAGSTAPSRRRPAVGLTQSTA